MFVCQFVCLIICIERLGRQILFFPKVQKEWMIKGVFNDLFFSEVISTGAESLYFFMSWLTISSLVHADIATAMHS
mgnify:CR=1 FL=1